MSGTCSHQLVATTAYFTYETVYDLYHNCQEEKKPTTLWSSTGTFRRRKQGTHGCTTPSPQSTLFLPTNTGLNNDSIVPRSDESFLLTAAAVVIVLLIVLCLVLLSLLLRKQNGNTRPRSSTEDTEELIYFDEEPSPSNCPLTNCKFRTNQGCVEVTVLPSLNALFDDDRLDQVSHVSTAYVEDDIQQQVDVDKIVELLQQYSGNRNSKNSSDDSRPSPKKLFDDESYQEK